MNYRKMIKTIEQKAGPSIIIALATALMHIAQNIDEYKNKI